MSARIEYYRDRKREWRWRAWSRNGRIVAESGEGYKRKVSAERGVRSALAVIFYGKETVVK